MKYNDETSMEPHLMMEIQECLTGLTTNWGRGRSNPAAMAKLSGIATALHALTGEVWTCEYWPDGYVFVNESQTECISTEL